MRFIIVFLFLLAHLALAAEKPNIVMIVVDDLGYGDLSSYGATDLQSPHLDSLLAGGLRFTGFYANCPVCSPTRASLLTGCYPDLVGVPGVIRTFESDNWGFLSRSATMLPEVLKKQGYATAAIGKWHLGLEAEDHPNARGFDHFHGFLGDMMDDYYHHRRHEQNYMRSNGETINPEGHASDLFTDWANDYLNARVGESEKPFFLYLAYNAPHTPIQPPADWLEKVKEREEGMTEKRAKLVALIEHMDEGIGRVLATLKKNDQWEDTLILFVSDNGGQLSAGADCGKLRGGKQDMYEGGIKVPAGAVWPGVIEPGLSDFQGMTMDLFATVIAAAGGEQPAEIDGQSLLPLLTTGRQEALDRDLFWVRREGNERYMGESSWAMRRGPWKLVKNTPMEPWELFNLKNDPLETTDLAAKNRPKFRELATGMRAHIQRGGAVPWQAR